MPLRLDSIGICPAILVPDPMSPSDDTFEGTVRPASAAGMGAFSFWAFWPTDYGIERANELLESLDARVGAVEAAGQWAAGPDVARTEAAALVDIAVHTDAPLIGACCLQPLTDWSAAVEGFRALCDVAGERGLQVSLEFVPGTGVPDLTTAWQVVDDAGAENGGILLDMMHWHRQPGGPDFDLLTQIPGERIPYVQVCDTVTRESTADAYMAEALAERRVPGEGDVDIARLLETLEQIGAVPWFAFEVFNQELTAAGPEAMVARLAASRVG